MATRSAVPTSERDNGHHQSTEFDYLDDDAFRSRYADPDHPTRMAFYVDGVHCTGCLYRIENLRNQVDDIAEIRLDMSRHVVDVTVTGAGRFGGVAARLKAMGYTPHPVVYATLRDSENRTHKPMLIKLGVAAAAAGNIMLLSTSLYSGAQSSAVGPAFEWLSFALFLPVLLYAALPFYHNAVTAFRNVRASIDVPIVAAILGGTAIGVVHLVQGSGDIYFDSLAMLVFLLLASRYFLLRVQNQFLAPTHLSAFYEAGRARVIDPDSGEVHERPVDTLTPGSRIVVRGGERFPVDGLLESEEGHVNAAVLTGEPYPRRVLAGESVFAGTQLVAGEVTIRAEAVGRDTRIGRLLEETERGVLGRTPLISITDRVAQWFSLSVLGIGVVFAILYATVDPPEALSRALALIILACPCALGLATPLTQSLALKKAARRGCLVKKAEALERFHRVTDVFFDKTGTLTHGELELLDWWPSPPNAHDRALIHALEADSAHPVARVLCAATRGATPVTISERTETAGVGVTGRCGDETISVRSLADAPPDAADFVRRGNTFAALYVDGRLSRIASFGDRVRASSRDVVTALEGAGCRVHLLTGDTEAPARAVAREVGIDGSRVWSGKSPEAKRDILSATPRSLMVGDGVNDSVALASATIGVAVQGSMETSFKAADVYLTQPGLDPLVDLHSLSRTTIAIIKRNLAISLVYNAAGATLALMGFITPLVAAVMMPASSITVVASSLIGTRFWRRLGRAPVPAADGDRSALAAPTVGGEAA